MTKAFLCVCSSFMLLASACGSADAPVAGDGETTTTAQASPAAKGAPITEPVCDFVGMTPEAATAILGFPVEPSSKVVEKDPSGGSCELTPLVPAADSFEVTIAVFPDTADGFEAFNKKFTAEKSKQGGRPLWTSPERVPGIGEIAYTFQSPDGGYDHAWVFTDGYRILVTDQNKTDVPGAPAKLQQVATAVAANVGGS